MSEFLLKSEMTHPCLIQVAINREMSKVRLELGHGGRLNEEHRHVFDIVFLYSDEMVKCHT